MQLQTMVVVLFLGCGLLVRATAAQDGSGRIASTLLKESTGREFEDTRFHAVHFPGGVQDGAWFDFASEWAEFDIRGPLRKSRKKLPKTLKAACWVPQENNAVFALGWHGRLMYWDGESDEADPMPVSANVDMRCTSLCYDPNSHRLFVAGTSRMFQSKLLAFDFEANTWHELAKFPGTVFAMAFDRDQRRVLGFMQQRAPAERVELTPEQQQRYAKYLESKSGFGTGGVTMRTSDYPFMPVKIVAVESKGTHLREPHELSNVRLPYVIEPPVYASGPGYQAAMTNDGLLALTTPGWRETKTTQAMSCFFRIDNDRVDLVYSGQSKLHD